MKAISALLLLATSVPGFLASPLSPISARSVATSRLEEIIDTIGAESLHATLEDAYAKVHQSIVKRGDLTRNDLEQGKCAPNIIIYARGTTEEGNMGSLGAPFQDKLGLLLLDRVIYQGVNNYPADVWGYLAGGSDSGAANMAAQVNRAATQCKGSKVFLSGYSQGAQVAHKAAKLIPTSQYGIIGGFVLFGDPNKGDALPGTLNTNVLTICNEGDLICEGYALPFGPHLEYEPTLPTAAAWIQKLAL